MQDFGDPSRPRRHGLGTTRSAQGPGAAAQTHIVSVGLNAGIASIALRALTIAISVSGLSCVWCLLSPSRTPALTPCGQCPRTSPYALPGPPCSA